MNNDTKKLRALLICFWVMIIATWLVCIISGTKLNIVVQNERLMALGNFIDSSIILRYSIAFILYYFNMILITHIILVKPLFKYKPIVISIFIICIEILKILLVNYDFSILFDFLYIPFCIILDKSKWKRSILVMIFTFIFSFLVSFIKSYNGIEIENLPTLVLNILMIDYYIFFITWYIYTRKVVNKNETMGCIFRKNKNLENHKWSFSNIISSCRSNYRSFIGCLKTDGWKIYCSIIFFIITYGSILIVGYIYRRIIEVTIAVICFHLFRRYDSKTYHASTSIKCWCVSFISFGTLIKLSIPITHSIFVVILLSYLLTKIMYYTQELIDHIQENKISKDLRRLENMSMEELKDLFDEYSQNDLHAIYKCLHKDRSTTYEYIALKHNMSRMTLYRIMKKVKERYQLLIK